MGLVIDRSSSSKPHIRRSPDGSSVLLHPIGGKGPAGPAGPAGPGGSDAGVAGYINTAGSATRVALTRTGSKPVGQGEIVVNPLDFGAVGDDPTHDLAGLQAAHNALPASGGTLWIPRPLDILGTLTTSGRKLGLLVWKDNVTLDGPGYLYQSTPTTPFQATVCVTGGGKASQTDPLNTALYRDTAQTVYAMSPVAEGATSVTLTTPSQASNFAVGDDIYIRTGNVTPAPNATPDAEYNIVKSVNTTTGVIGLRYPTGKPFALEYYTSAVTSTIPDTDTTDHGFGSAPMGVSNMTNLVVRNFRCKVRVDSDLNADYSIYVSQAIGVYAHDFHVEKCGTGIVGGRSFRTFDFSHITADRPAGGIANGIWFAPSTGCSNGKVHDCTLVSEEPRRMHAHEHIVDYDCYDNTLKTANAVGIVGTALFSAKARSRRVRFLRNSVIGAYTAASNDVFDFSGLAIGCEVKGNKVYTLPTRYMVNIETPGSDVAVENNVFPIGSTFNDNSGGVARFRNNVNCSLDPATVVQQPGLAVATMQRDALVGNVTVTAGTLYAWPLTPSASKTITGVTVAVGNVAFAGSTLARAQFGTWDEATHTFTPLAESATQHTALNAAGANGSVNFPFAATGRITGQVTSLTPTPGVRYAVVFISVGHTAGNLKGGSGLTATLAVLSPELVRSTASQTDAPTAAAVIASGSGAWCFAYGA